MNQEAAINQLLALVDQLERRLTNADEYARELSRRLEHLEDFVGATRKTGVGEERAR